MLQRKELKIEKNPTKRVANKKNSSYNHGGDSACHIKEGIKIMASHKNVSASLHDDKGTWVVRARVYDPNTGKTKNKSKSTGLKVKDNTKRKAERMLKDIALQWEEEANSTASSENPYFKESIQAWLDKKALSVTDTTLFTYTKQTRNYILPALGDIRTKELKLSHIQQFYNYLLKTMSVKSVRLCHNVIRGTLTDAVREGLIPVNFSIYAEFPKMPKYKGQSYTPEQVKKLLNAAKEEGEPYNTAIILAVVYGLRRSEICGLRWCDIDFEAGTLHVCNTVVQCGNEVKEIERTKSQSSNRIIWLIESTIPYLENLKQMQIDLGIDAKNVCTRLYGDTFGKPMNYQALYRHTQSAMTKAGLERLRLHDLRHTAASLLIEGATPKQIQEFLGHSNISVTMDIYTHLTDTTKAKTSSIMNSILQNSNIM